MKLNGYAWVITLNNVLPLILIYNLESMMSEV